MESEDDSRSSSNSSGSSNSSSNGPASPPQQEHENESNDQPDAANNEHQSRSSSPDSNSFQEKPENTNQSMSPVREQNISNENHLKDEDDEEELELSDIEEDSNKPKKTDISHEDLSDISDLESNSPTQNFTDLRQKLDKQRLNGSGNKDGQDKTNDEDELDFEVDEVREVSENKKLADVKESVEKQPKEEGEAKSDDEVESGEELEDGEVTDGDDKRPEESEPKAVCRFFTRGQCTWGMSCRFLHPGTTDKGNYTMFDMVRPIPVPQAVPRIMPMAYDYRHDRPPIHHIPPHTPFDHPRLPPVADSESAWDRGVRTAKEMIRKAKKRKEQDIDFDEKKMNLSGPVDEIEKDPYYVRGSPEATPPYDRVPGRERPRYDYSPPPKYARGGPAGHFEEDAFGRVRRYRELPAHRMPHYEDDELNKRPIVRSTREVIVEKADEWNDPWARKTARRGSAGRERVRGKERSYSSNSSYSTSSETSRSRSSSESSGSPSAPRRGRFESHRSKERLSQRKQIIRAKSRSSSVKRRHSPPVRQRTIEKKLGSPIPMLKRKKPVSPPLRQERIRTSHSKKKHDSSSGSGSSSGSESDTSYSSSTSDSKGKKKREKIVVERKQPTSKAEIMKKRVTPVKEDKKDKISEKAAAAKMKSTRREELLKQLKAVEDAIARKKSKIN